MKIMKNFLGICIGIYVGGRVIKELSWECRKEILEGKSIFYKMNWYLSHFLT